MGIKFYDQETDVEYDPLTGITSVIHPTQDGGFVYQQAQETQDILDYNKLLYNEIDHRASWGNGIVRAAQIPLVIWFKLKRLGITDDPKAYMKWLNDPANQGWRTRPGSL